MQQPYGTPPRRGQDTQRQAPDAPRRRTTHMSRLPHTPSPPQTRPARPPSPPGTPVRTTHISRLPWIQATFDPATGTVHRTDTGEPIEMSGLDPRFCVVCGAQNPKYEFAASEDGEEPAGTMFEPVCSSECALARSELLRKLEEMASTPAPVGSRLTDALSRFLQRPFVAMPEVPVEDEEVDEDDDEDEDEGVDDEGEEEEEEEEVLAQVQSESALTAANIVAASARIPPLANGAELLDNDGMCSDRAEDVSVLTAAAVDADAAVSHRNDLRAAATTIMTVLETARGCIVSAASYIRKALMALLRLLPVPQSVVHGVEWIGETLRAAASRFISASIAAVRNAAAVIASRILLRPTVLSCAIRHFVAAVKPAADGSGGTAAAAAAGTSGVPTVVGGRLRDARALFIAAMNNALAYSRLAPRIAAGILTDPATGEPLVAAAVKDIPGGDGDSDSPRTKQALSQHINAASAAMEPELKRLRDAVADRVFKPLSDAAALLHSSGAHMRGSCPDVITRAFHWLRMALGISAASIGAASVECLARIVDRVCECAAASIDAQMHTLDIMARAAVGMYGKYIPGIVHMDAEIEGSIEAVNAFYDNPSSGAAAPDAAAATAEDEGGSDVVKEIRPPPTAEQRERPAITEFDKWRTSVRHTIGGLVAQLEDALATASGTATTDSVAMARNATAVLAAMLARSPDDLMSATEVQDALESTWRHQPQQHAGPGSAAPPPKHMSGAEVLAMVPRCADALELAMEHGLRPADMSATDLNTFVQIVDNCKTLLWTLCGRYHSSSEQDDVTANTAAASIAVRKLADVVFALEAIGNGVAAYVWLHGGDVTFADVNERSVAAATATTTAPPQRVGMPLRRRPQQSTGAGSAGTSASAAAATATATTTTATRQAHGSDLPDYEVALRSIPNLPPPEDVHKKRISADLYYSMLTGTHLPPNAVLDTSLKAGTQHWFANRAAVMFRMFDPTGNPVADQDVRSAARSAAVELINTTLDANIGKIRQYPCNMGVTSTLDIARALAAVDAVHAINTGLQEHNERVTVPWGIIAAETAAVLTAALIEFLPLAVDTSKCDVSPGHQDYSVACEKFHVVLGAERVVPYMTMAILITRFAVGGAYWFTMRKRTDGVKNVVSSVVLTMYTVILALGPGMSDYLYPLWSGGGEIFHRNTQHVAMMSSMALAALFWLIVTGKSSNVASGAQGAVRAVGNSWYTRTIFQTFTRALSLALGGVAVPILGHAISMFVANHTTGSVSLLARMQSAATWGDVIRSLCAQATGVLGGATSFARSANVTSRLT